MNAHTKAMGVVLAIYACIMSLVAAANVNEKVIDVSGSLIQQGLLRKSKPEVGAYYKNSPSAWARINVTQSIGDNRYLCSVVDPYDVSVVQSLLDKFIVETKREFADGERLAGGIFKYVGTASYKTVLGVKSTVRLFVEADESETKGYYAKQAQEQAKIDALRQKEFEAKKKRDQEHAERELKAQKAREEAERIAVENKRKQEEIARQQAQNDEKAKQEFVPKALGGLQLSVDRYVKVQEALRPYIKTTKVYLDNVPNDDCYLMVKEYQEDKDWPKMLECMWKNCKRNCTADGMFAINVDSAVTRYSGGITGMGGVVPSIQVVNEVISAFGHTNFEYIPFGRSGDGRQVNLAERTRGDNLGLVFVRINVQSNEVFVARARKRIKGVQFCPWSDQLLVFVDPKGSIQRKYAAQLDGNNAARAELDAKHARGEVSDNRYYKELNKLVKSNGVKVDNDFVRAFCQDVNRVSSNEVDEFVTKVGKWPGGGLKK